MNSQTWVEQSQYTINLRNGQGRPWRVVREVYLHLDVPCHSPLCLSGCQQDEDPFMLPRESTHYIVPDCQVAKDFLELFERPEMTGIVFTQTSVHYVQHEGSRRLVARLQHLVHTPGSGAVILCNEFQKYSHCQQEEDETKADLQIRSTFRAAGWLYDHLAGQIPVIMVSENEQVVNQYKYQKLGVLVMSMRDYLSEFWADLNDVMEQYDCLSLAASSQKAGRQYTGYFPQSVIEEGLNSGRFVSGTLNVNRFNAAQEAFVSRGSVDQTNESGVDILIVGAKDRNRAVHGDQVVIELYPKSLWQARSMFVNISEENEEEEEETNEDESETSDGRLPTGRVVAVLQRQWRDYVATLSSDEVSQKGSNKTGRILVIPWDYRVPKIRIATSQVEILRDQRFLVHIDSWSADSQYPNGHLVRMLGPIGELETEIAALLAENELSVSSFTTSQLAELPNVSSEHPWQLSPEEVQSRRDLRQTHLVFTIDPKDCEDVDDALSLRQLDNGNLELGVHIADVTYFVRSGSLTDKEAQARSTTLYLADRRHDMLPSVLSTNLCSLVSGQDRYAVSVIWELTPAFEVINVWYGRTIIHSQFKLYYELAQQIFFGCSDQDILDAVSELRGVTDDELQSRLAELRWTLKKLTELGRSLKARRTRRGALELESFEVQVQLTETKKIEDLTPREHLEVHETVAECMIFANHWVAKKIYQAFPSRALLRSHPPPRQEQFDSLLKCASACGFHIDTNSNKALAESLDNCVHPHNPVVNLLLRSLATFAMSNARYFCTGALHSNQFAHYGLALDLYTHFTSPIRRYADVVVHRLLLAAMKKNETPQDTTSSEEGILGSKQLQDLADHMNIKHRAAQFAQSESQELFQSIFFKDHEGDDDICTAEAIIYQLRANGVMVYVPRYGVKGVAYLKDCSHRVLYLPDGVHAEWVAGSLTCTDNRITVRCALGEQSFVLLENLTVRLSVNKSRAHCQSLKIEIIARKLQTSAQLTQVTSKADIVKRVKQDAEDTTGDSSQSLLDMLSPEMSQYRQSDPQKSLYLLFDSFFQMGLQQL